MLQQSADWGSVETDWYKVIVSHNYPSSAVYPTLITKSMHVLLFTTTDTDFQDAASAVESETRDSNVMLLRGNVLRCSAAEVLMIAGNSFGIMDRGLDLQIVQEVAGIDVMVKSAIDARGWRGELPVGAAVTLLLPDGARFKYVCYAPTMRSPGNMAATTHNAYHAMRAALLACSALPNVNAIACQMFCNEEGGIAIRDVVRQVQHACDTFQRPLDKNWESVVRSEAILRREAGHACPIPRTSSSPNLQNFLHDG